MEQSVESGVTVSLGSHEPSDSESGGFASVNTSLINLSDVNLDGRVILRVEDSVGGGALSGNVQINELPLIVLERFLY
jgi:hypothetical protein